MMMQFLRISVFIFPTTFIQHPLVTVSTSVLALTTNGKPPSMTLRPRRRSTPSSLARLPHHRAVGLTIAPNILTSTISNVLKLNLSKSKVFFLFLFLHHILSKYIFPYLKIAPSSSTPSLGDTMIPSRHRYLPIPVPEFFRQLYAFIKLDTFNMQGRPMLQLELVERAFEDARLAAASTTLNLKGKNPITKTLTGTVPIPGANYIVLTKDPRNIRHILQTNFDNYPKGEEFRAIFRDLLGDGIFNADGHEWLTQRKAASGMFTDRGFGDFFFEVFFRHARTVGKYLVDSIKTTGGGKKSLKLSASQGGVTVRESEDIDIFLLSQKYTLESIGEVGFGTKIGCLSPQQISLEAGHRDAAPFLKAFDKAQSVVERRLLNPLWRQTKFFSKNILRSGGEWELANELIPALRGVARGIVEEKTANRKKISQESHGEPASASESRSDFLSLYMAKEPDLPTETYVDIALNFLIAGRDTTANLIAWTLYELHRSRDPKQTRIRENLMQEIREFIEIYDITNTESDRLSIDSPEIQTRSEKPFSFHSLKSHSTPYLTAVLEEVLRLHPPVPRDLKVAETDDVLPDGTFVPAGCWVGYVIYSVQRCRDIWGDDAVEFKPERWFNRCQGGAKEGLDVVDNRSEISQSSKRPFSDYPVFNGGPRLCLGQRMALLEAKVFLITILGTLDKAGLRLAEGGDFEGQKCEGDRTLVLNMVPACKLRVVEK